MSATKSGSEQLVCVSACLITAANTALHCNGVTTAAAVAAIPLMVVRCTYCLLYCTIATAAYHCITAIQWTFLTCDSSTLYT
jgi:hypothetical protein